MAEAYEDEYEMDEVSMRPSSENKGRLKRLLKKRARLEKRIKAEQAARPELPEEDMSLSDEAPAEESPVRDRDEVLRRSKDVDELKGAVQDWREEQDRDEIFRTSKDVDELKGAIQDWRGDQEGSGVAAPDLPEPAQVDESLPEGSRSSMIDRAATIADLKSRPDYVTNLSTEMDKSRESSWLGGGGYRFRYIPGLAGEPAQIEVSGGISGKIKPGEKRYYKEGDDIFEGIMEERATLGHGRRSTDTGDGEASSGGAPEAEPVPETPEGVADQETGPPSVDVASDDAPVQDETAAVDAPVQDEAAADEEAFQKAIDSDPEVQHLYGLVNEMNQDAMDLHKERQALIEEINTLPGNILGRERRDIIARLNQKIGRLERDIERMRAAGLGYAEMLVGKRKEVEERERKEFQRASR